MVEWCNYFILTTKNRGIPNVTLVYLTNGDSNMFDFWLVHHKNLDLNSYIIMVLIWASRWHSIILDVFQTMSYHYLSRRYLADENKFFGPPPRIAGCSMMVSSSSKRRQRMTKVHHRYNTKLTKQAYGLMRMQLAKLSTSIVTFVFSFDNI